VTTGRELPGLPDWLRPVADAAGSITASDLTKFLPPPGTDARRGAVLMLFGEGESGGELLLTERAHHMRSHPGQVSFPGGSVDPGETAEQAALREP
jgi:8-oxo-dGTP pyrophosphatase MutT (NUDIX family)